MIVGGIFSHEVGMIKSNPDIYRLILKNAQMKPEETVFIDDKESSLKPTAKLGMSPILFISPEAVSSKLN